MDSCQLFPFRTRQFNEAINLKLLDGDQSHSMPCSSSFKCSSVNEQIGELLSKRKINTKNNYCGTNGKQNIGRCLTSVKVNSSPSSTFGMVVFPCETTW